MKDLIKRIGLQFFAGEIDDDFADDFDDIPEYYGYDHMEDEAKDSQDESAEAEDAEKESDDEESVEESSDAEPNQEEESGEDSDENADEDEDTDAADEPIGAGEESPEIENKTEHKTDDGLAELMDELKALGYVGTDLSSIAAEMRRKREADEGIAASAERKARNAASKEHISSARPERSVAGDGTDGFSVKQVRNLQHTLGCSYERARDLLAKQYRALG